jgi:hypothetical protein
VHLTGLEDSISHFKLVIAGSPRRCDPHRRRVKFLRLSSLVVGVPYVTYMVNICNTNRITREPSYMRSWINHHCNITLNRAGNITNIKEALTYFVCAWQGELRLRYRGARPRGRSSGSYVLARTLNLESQTPDFISLCHTPISYHCVILVIPHIH